MATLIGCGGGTVNNCPFPVGFGGFFQTDPNTIYSGTTWEQKKDVFILAAGTAYPAGSTGGEAEHTLTLAEIAAHIHSGGGTPATEPNGAIFKAWSMAKLSDSGASGGRYYPVDTTSAGGSQPHNNMPPYYSMPFWIRTA